MLSKDCHGCQELFEFEQEPRVRFGDRLRSIRESSDLSVAEVSERSGYSANSVTVLECVAAPPTDLVSLVRLADALGVHRKDVVLLALGRLITDFPPRVRRPVSGKFPPERLWW
ncbi:helix-turn-helix transcriptional regulator [Amycolatopsis minnesotensis]|uniref:helix-turn-helix domain-containing protein n=1 Tax=Amycolatopsis minnesotensis TaxID=337894 RepID=UPI0031CF44D6